MNDENIGRLLAQKYELTRLLGQGGMGAVYEARNQIGKRVAVKLLLKPEFAQNRELAARFFREAKASAAVESKHVVDVYETGVDGQTGFPFIIMAYLSGEDLEQFVERVGPLNPVAAVRIISQAATGLAKAHDAGIVHRDIKPANLFLARDEGESVVKILDFGIAKVSMEDLSPAGSEGHSLTRTGAMLGTPLYMSPEQAQGLKTIDARSDVWSLGMCLYQALSGRLPFDDVDTIGKLIVAIVARDVKPLHTFAPWIRPELAAVVHWALEREAEKRIPSARDFIAALSPFVNGSLTLTPNVMSGVQQTLDATFAPEAVPLTDSGSIPASLSGPGTTAGLSGQRFLSPSKFSASNRTLRFALIGVLAVGAGVFAVTKVGRKEYADLPHVAATSAPTQQSATSAAVTATTDASPAAPVDDTKVGILTVKMPEGYTVKVDGFSPGSSGSTGAPRKIENGKLELRGEFQRKFLVAIFDNNGIRLMVQDVYLYDNKVDPEVLDTKVGAINVEKPKRKSALGASAAPTTPKPVSTPSELPARF